jgi:hypothetical protein
MISVRTVVSAQRVTPAVALAMLAEYFRPDANWQWETIPGGHRAIHVSGAGLTPTTFTAPTADMRVLRQAMVTHETEAAKAVTRRWDVISYKAEVWRLLCYRLRVAVRSNGPASLLLNFLHNQQNERVRAELLLDLMGVENPTDEVIKAAYGRAMELVPAAV